MWVSDFVARVVLAVVGVVVILVVISRGEGLARALRSDWVVSADANWDDDPGRVITPGKDVGAPEFNNWGYDMADDGSKGSGQNEVDG